MDPDHAAAIVLATRSVYNYHCRDLVETFGNLISLQWTSLFALSPEGNINQLAVNILRRILTADVKHYYNHAMDALKDGEYKKQLYIQDVQNLIQTNAVFTPK